MRRALQILCFSLVLLAGWFVLRGLLTADYSAKPSRDKMEAELTALQSKLGGLGLERSFFDKGTMMGLSVESPLPADVQRLVRRFDSFANGNGWLAVPVRINDESIHRKYCKGRLSLMLDFVSDVHPYFGYGIYWATNQNNYAYCAAKANVQTKETKGPE